MEDCHQEPYLKYVFSSGQQLFFHTFVFTNMKYSAYLTWSKLRQFQISGPSGCGKTQFCMMLSVIATLPWTLGGLDGSVLYIDTESAFSAER